MYNNFKTDVFMLKKFFILLFVFAAIADSVNSQARFGLKMGYNYSGVIADYAGVYVPGLTGRPSPDHPFAAGFPDNFKMKSGVQAGFIVDLPMNDIIAIQPGAKFTMMGFIDEHKPNQSVYKRRFSLYYLQVPINVQYRMNIAEDTNLLFQSGPYIGFGLFGRQSLTTSAANAPNLGDPQKKITFGNKKDIGAVDFGIGAGFGIEYYRFQLMVGYDFGLNLDYKVLRFLIRI